MTHLARGRLIGWRLVQAIPVIVGIVIVSFVLTRALPGDPGLKARNPLFCRV